MPRLLLAVLASALVAGPVYAQTEARTPTREEVSAIEGTSKDGLNVQVMPNPLLLEIPFKSVSGRNGAEWMNV